MYENEISAIIVDCSIKIHKKLGPGLYESVYEYVLNYELNKRGLNTKTQSIIPVYYEGNKIEMGFRADIIVEDKVIIELKSVEVLARVHYKQLLTYLRLSNMKLGLLINFNENLITQGIHRVVNNL
jgi:GxxExxY protein